MPINKNIIFKTPFLKIEAIYFSKKLADFFYYSAYISLSFFYISLMMHLPVSIHTTAVHDDALFWSQAENLISGHWLGLYNQLTLLKGPGFSFFTAINALVGVPITLSIAIMYLFSCLLLAETFNKIMVSKIIVLLVFGLTLFHPALFPVGIIRDNIISSLVLIFISVLIRIVFLKRNKYEVLWIVFYGFLFGLFWITREDSVWIIPGSLFLVLSRLIKSKKEGRPLKVILAPLAFFVITSIIFINLVSFINLYKYGVFETIEIKGTVFTRVIKDLDGVVAGPSIPFVPVPFAKRELIYKVSPTFLKMKDYFEKDGLGWTVYGCSFYPQACGDYAAGWFLFALRDAIASVGGYDNPAHAIRLYNNISDEIEVACRNKIITCKPNLLPLMPRITITQLENAPKKVFDAIRLSLLQSSVLLTEGDSADPSDRLNSVRSFLGNPRTTLSPSEKIITIKGWYYSGKDDWIVLKCIKDGTEYERNIDRHESPDIAAKLQNGKGNLQRFSVIFTQNDICKITNNRFGSTVISSGEFYKISDGNIVIDEVSRSDETFDRQYKTAFVIKMQLVNIYEIVLPILFVIGVLSFISYLIISLFNKSCFSDLFLISTSIWVMYFSKLLLLSLVEISSFPALNQHYLGPAFPLLVIASALSFVCFFGLHSYSKIEK